MNRFSVVIPVYNAEAFLSDCLDSLIAQDYGNWCAICVNDGSTDRSSEILSEYSARDSRIKVIRQKNAGVSSARNTAIKSIEPHRDNWISFLDADDFVAPNMFSSLNKMLSEEEVAEVNYIKTKCMPLTSRTMPHVGGGILSRKIISREDYFREGNVGGFIASIMVRSDFLKHTGIMLPEDMKVLEDQVFSMRLALKAEKIMVIDYPFYYYYQDLESQGNRNFHVDDVIRCVNYLWKEFANNQNRFIRSYFHNKYLPIKMGMIKKFCKGGSSSVSLCKEIDAARYLLKYHLRILTEFPGRVINKIVSALR